ncbi:MAG: ABC transporter substrate-binding protein [Actinomycetota bacterium]|nr:ABC transporter substrate-binding protein [Actinomycetota bacterium]
MLSRKLPTVSRARRATVLVVIGMAAAACGGNHTNGSAAVTPGSTGAPTTVAPAVAKFGTLVSPCGSGSAKGATANGVTNTSITIGYGDDAGYSAAPGLDKEMSDAVKPMIKWCNDQGGINGRKIVGKYYDAKVLQVTQVMTQACNDKVFMLVGQGWVLDQGQEQTRIACKLATIPAFAVATAFASGPGMQQPLPNPGDEVTISSAFQIAQLFPDAVKKAAFVFAEFPATRETRDKAAAGYPKAGWKFLACDQIYNVAGESDWKPFASNLKACGVQAVVWVGSPDPNLENFLNASKQVGFAPQAWATDPNQYTAAFAKWNGQNGGAADNVYVRMTGVPFEFAAQAPAVKQYMDLVAKSHGTIGLLGEQAASAFLLWATGVKACGSDVTAKCVLDSAAKQTGWTGGGMHIPADPGSNTASKCGMLLKLKGAEWVKVVPSGDTLFDCNDKYLVEGITTSAVTAAKLDANRVATQFGTFTPK